MLLTIYNLPGHVCSTDVKSLLHEKCGLTDFILDNLVSHINGKRVTVGLADEQDAAILVRKINGLYLNGHQLYVEDNRKKRQSDQPYQASAVIDSDSQYKALVGNPQHNMMGDGMAAVVNNIMMMNYNMMPVYMPMMPMEQNVPYMGYGGSQIEDPRSMAIVHNEQGPVGFHGESNRSREQGHHTFGHCDGNRNPTSDRPSRWNEQPAPIEAQVRRDRSPPDHRWAPRETNQASHPPFGVRNSERPGRRNQDLYSPRPPEPCGEPQNMPWGPDPNPPRLEPDQDWTAAPNQNWQPEPNRVWDKNNSRREEQHNNPGPKPSISNTYLADERHGDRQLNPPKRNHPEREGGPANWSQIANNYPPSKKPRDNLDKRGIEGPRQKIFAPNRSTNFRPAIRAPFQPDAAAPRFTNPATLPIRPAKLQSVKSMINKDQTCRGQTTATLAKQAMAGSTIANTELTSRILKELKVCIKGRIDVMLGDELSCNVADVIARYRLKFSERDDRILFQMIRYNQCVHHEKNLEVSRGAKSDAVLKPHETESKEEANKDKQTGEKKAVKEKRVPQKTNNPPQTDTQIVKGAKSDAFLKPHETESKEEANKVEPTGETKAVQEERVLQKTNNPPQTDKQILKENKQQENLEFNTKDYFKLDPTADNVLDDELEKLTEIFARECDNPIDSMDETIKQNSVVEFRRVRDQLYRQGN